MRRTDVIFACIVIALVILAGSLTFLVFNRGKVRDYPYNPADSLDRFILPKNMTLNDTIDDYLTVPRDFALIGHKASSPGNNA